MSDPASLRAAREAIDLAIGNCMRRRHEESDEAFGRRLGYLVSAVRDEAAALSGEPPAPTPEPSWPSTEWIERIVEATWGYVSNEDNATIEGAIEHALSHYGLVPPAAPTAATPDENDPFFKHHLAESQPDDDRLTEGVSWGASRRATGYYEWMRQGDPVRPPQNIMHKAIVMALRIDAELLSRRTLGGEPGKTWTMLSTVCACGKSSGNGYAVPGAGGNCTWMCWECYHNLTDTSRG